MKYLLYCFLVVSLNASAVMPDDLKDANLVQGGVCIVNSMMVQCAEVEKNGTRYILVIDGKGLAVIYQVKDGATLPYTSDTMDIVWVRRDDSV